MLTIVSSKFSFNILIIMTNKNSTPTYFLSQTNPEVFTATPRPGGRVHIEIPPKPNRLKENAAKARRASESASKTSTRKSRASAAKSKSSIYKIKPADKDLSTTTASRKSLLTITTNYEESKDINVDSCPKEFKVKQIIAATPWSVEFDEYLEPTEESKRIPDPFQDSVDMLAMSISVIMLLSRGYDKISNTQFKWVYSYLDCIRDEFGQIPPNVQGILNHITLVTGGQITSFLDDMDYEPDELAGKPTSVRISTAPPDVAPQEESNAE